MNCPPPPPRPATIPELLLWWCFTALIRRGKISPPKKYKERKLEKKEKLSLDFDISKSFELLYSEFPPLHLFRIATLLITKEILKIISPPPPSTLAPRRFWFLRGC